jgi:Mg-chelatase subunit ChlD
MNASCLISAFSVLAILCPVEARAAVASNADGVAVAIIVDTSGSMNETVRDSRGNSAAKATIAKRALATVLQRLQEFATRENATGTPRRMEFGLFVFANDGARALVPFGPFDSKQAGTWAQRVPASDGGTPLGQALETASRAVLGSPLLRKHVLVITDGINTVGPAPDAVLPRLQKEAADRQTGLSVHFVAFDVDAKLFDPVKKLGATVVGALDETQLNTQLGFILEKKILLEEEEPVSPSKTH